MTVHRRSRLTRGLWARLVAIALVPIVGFATFSYHETARSWRVASGAAELAEGVEQVSTLAPVGLLVSQDVHLEGVRQVSTHLGIDPSVVGEILDVDLDRELASTRRELDERLVRLDDLSGGPALRRGVEDLRHGLRAGTVDVRTGGDAWALSGEAEALASDALRATARRALDVEGSAGAQLALTTLEHANEAASAAFAQIGILGRFALVAGSGAPELLEEARTATERLLTAQSDLDDTATGPLAARWAEVRDDPAIVDSEAAVAAAVASGALPVLGSPNLRDVFRAGLARLDAYYAFVHDVAEVAADEAAALRADALDQRRDTLVVTGFLVVLTLLVTAVIARSIGAPLRRLASRAERVSAGAVSDPTVPMPGAPREITRVADTFDEVVTNLRLVESQLSALAAGELDDEALDEPVPGRIGELLHGAVGRLSRSMQEREELATQLAHEAAHDALTGLPNRAAAARELERALARAQRAGASVAAFYVDLDGFKHVNDNHGHDAGDLVLKATADRLVRTVRAGDFVARIGGDEFLVVTEQAADIRALVELGERLVAEVSAPISLGAVATRAGASVGIAVTSDGELDADGLLRNADLAGYEAKAGGRGRVELFDDDLRAELARVAAVEAALRDALRTDELELHFQPVADAGDGAVHSVEALIRWHRPGHGLVMPGEFIPIAEASDLVIDLGRWVLRTACEHLVAWRDDPVLGDLAIAVNLSGRHVLSLGLVDDIADALAATGVPAERLMIEITETVLLTDVPLIADQLTRLRALGVRVALDDFGTGYTSLSHLRNLPVDIVKIDRSLVVSGAAEPDAEVLRLLVGTAHALGLGLIAEGVETREQFQRMNDLGCDQLQGYLICRPSPLAVLRTRLAAPQMTSGDLAAGPGPG